MCQRFPIVLKYKVLNVSEIFGDCEDGYVYGPDLWKVPKHITTEGKGITCPLTPSTPPINFPWAFPKSLAPYASLFLFAITL
jgi:hypothetical protein